MSNWRVRSGGILLALATLWYVPWVFNHLNQRALWLSVPSAAATIMTAAMTLLATVNHWQYGAPAPRPVERGREPEVAVLTPTYGEPADMVYRTVHSLLTQDYPTSRIRLIISDDSHRESIRSVVDRLREEHLGLNVIYHEPPRQGDTRRRGEAKAGNLNSILDHLDTYAPHARFVETRDADDEVGDREFLRQVMGQHMRDDKIAFVQTVKEARVSPSDPFGNLEPMFYRRAMLAKHAANAVCPCGSDLVWRREALEDIGGFPTWNLVEDLQSGVEVLKRGWRSVYLPILGALGQTAPEDMANVMKQRGTWAVDTMRVSFWGDKSGLSLRQHLQFAELGFCYLFSFAILAFMATPILSLTLGVYPLITTPGGYAEHFWPYAASVELLLISLGQGLSYEALWRSRQTWVGLAPVYARATPIALLFGPRGKPAYRVTRKRHLYGWYWRETLPQILLLAALVGAGLYHVATHSLIRSADLGSLFWAGFFALALSRIVRNSWHDVETGTALRQRLAGWTRKLLLRGARRLLGGGEG